MKKITIRPHLISDAKRFCEILNGPDMPYLNIIPQSIQKEKEYLRKTVSQRKEGMVFGYSVLYGEKVVGSVGLKLNPYRKYIGEIGYFIDQKYWGKGIATEAVSLLEKETVEKLGIKRLEVVMMIENIGSEKVAIKSGYKKEGKMKKSLKNRDGFMRDSFLYAKIFD